MKTQLETELREPVASLGWLLNQLPTAPETNPASADVFALLDQPMTRSEIIAGLRFHAGRIMEIAL